MSKDSEPMAPDAIRQIIERSAPDARLAAHVEYWGDEPPPTVAAELQIAQEHAARRSWQKVIASLAHLDRWRIANEAAIAQAPTTAARRKGQVAAQRVNTERRQTREAEARTHWEQLSHLDERERASVISRKMGITERTVRRYVAPLRK